MPTSFLISIHAPTWGATSRSSLALTRLQNFNPRTHVGCDQRLGLVYERGEHFNPRTHVGCDKDGHGAADVGGDFNPRTHVGCDWAEREHRIKAMEISIHAPTWGATRRPRSRATSTGHFNPRTHVGCDDAFKEKEEDGEYFNPRTHVGCDFASTLTADSFANFNPRTHVGCDVPPRRDERHTGISIHAPTWGATDTEALKVALVKISIHAPTWGATCRTRPTRCTGYFNPRTHVGCDGTEIGA